MSVPQIHHMRTGIERRMRWSCTIQRNIATGRDTRNNALPPEWSDQATVHCYVWQGAGRGETRTAEIVATLDTWNLMLPIGTDVTEADQISTITDIYGEQWNSVALNIKSVQRRSTHLLVIAEEAR